MLFALYVNSRDIFLEIARRIKKDFILREEDVLNVALLDILRPFVQICRKRNQYIKVWKLKDNRMLDMLHLNLKVLIDFINHKSHLSLK